MKNNNEMQKPQIIIDPDSLALVLGRLLLQNLNLENQIKNIKLQNKNESK